jgi:ketosteroid isomerase-like protein
MSTDANRETIRRAFVAWHDEGAPIADVFAPEMTWRIEGRSVVAGDYANRQEFIDRVLAPFGARFAVCAQGVDATVRVVHDLARRAGGRRHRVFRQHRVRRALATLRRGGDVSCGRVAQARGECARVESRR